MRASKWCKGGAGSLALWVLVVMGVGCATQTLRNTQLWYSITVPKTWKAGSDAVLRSTQGDTIRITRLRDDSDLESFVRSQRRAFQIEKSDFVTEDEAWLKINGRKAWRMVGTDKSGGREEVWMLVFVDTGQYKYRLWVRTPNDTFRKRQSRLNEIIKTFVVKIPEY